MYAPLAFLVIMLSAWSINTTNAFSSSVFRHASAPLSKKTALKGGVGVANTYSWNEEQFEIEVKIKVPPKTSAKDIKFKCSSDSIDLHLLNNDEKVVFLDGSRKVRGKICVDGTFWSIEGNGDADREITITLEKHIVPTSSAGGTQTYDTLTDFDWGGLYPNDEEEVSHRKYDEAEELNVREYAAKLGVDIDNIDMSKVDPTMFGTGGYGKDGDNASDDAEEGEDGNGKGAVGGNRNKGFNFNITQATLEQLTKTGLAKEVIQQGDGMEYELGSDGSLDEEKVFSMLGKDVSDDELRDAGIVGGGSAAVPTMWDQQTVPVEEAPGYTKTFDTDNSFADNADGIIESEIVEREILERNTVVDMFSETLEKEVAQSEDMDNVQDVTAEIVQNNDVEQDASTNDEKAVQDPVDTLTVVRLKEILREQGLKVSGTKQILRDRLRGHVNTLLQEE